MMGLMDTPRHPHAVRRDEHRHRLGAFDVEGDPSKYDGLIAEFCGAMFDDCLYCQMQVLRDVVGGDDATERLLELCARAHVGKSNVLRAAAAMREDPAVSRACELIELQPVERNAELAVLRDRDERTEVVTIIGRLLTGAWAMRQLANDRRQKWETG